jgi:hypothetical protein
MAHPALKLQSPEHATRKEKATQIANLYRCRVPQKYVERPP